MYDKLEIATPYEHRTAATCKPRSNQQTRKAQHHRRAAKKKKER